MHLHWCFSSASRAPSVPENEADNGEDDNPEMITTFQLGGDAIGNVPHPIFLVARYLILSQFSIDCLSKGVCLRGSAPDPAGGLIARPDPSLKMLVTHTVPSVS